MGCDIRVCVEIRLDVNGQSKWVNANLWIPDPYFGEAGYSGHAEYYLRPVYDFRDYELFGLLAGVRGSGPAIAPPRGLPADISKHTAAEAARCWDSHSHSYLTLHELKAHKPEPIEFLISSVKANLAKLSDFHRNVIDDDCRIVFWFES